MIPARFNRPLEDMSRALETLNALDPPDDITNLVDLAARVDAIRKNIEKLCKEYKDILWAGHQEGAELNGDHYTACLTLYEAMRFNQKKLQEERPRIFQQYQYSSLDSRTTFKPRG